jgi:hypothetical protein
MFSAGGANRESRPGEELPMRLTALGGNPNDGTLRRNFAAEENGGSSGE